MQTGTNRYLYDGKEAQTTGGLSYLDFGARFYSARHGRWFNLDPLLEDYIDLSPYAYAGNNPLRFIDPDGKRWVDKTKKYDVYVNGQFTEHATADDRYLGGQLLKTPTGREQLEKLVSNEAPITVSLNKTEERVTERGTLVMGVANKSIDIGSKGNTLVGVGIIMYEKNVITIAESKGLEINHLMGAAFGHEIEHTTQKNVDQSVRNYKAGRTVTDVEANPTRVEHKILNEFNKQEKPVIPSSWENFKKNPVRLPTPQFKVIWKYQ